MMVEDTFYSKKPLQDSDQVVRNLLALRDELFKRATPGIASEIFYKINSCLYRKVV